FQPGLGLPVPQKVRFVSGSYEPVTQMGAPPCCHESSGQVLLPGSPGAGTVLNRHTSAPVRTSYAATQQFVPNSLVAGPRMTLSLTTSGATFNCSPCFQSRIVLFQTAFPVFA